MRGLPFAILAVGLHSVLFPHFSNAESKIGDRAPDFALEDQWGNTVRLTDFKGKTALVLAFYIKAGTPG